MGHSGFKPSPAPLNYLQKHAATDHTVYVYTTLFVITCDCVVPNCMCVCVCNDSVGPLAKWVPT